MSARYVLHSCDPDGTFLEVSWETEFLPRVGEEVLLPDESGGYQEMTVTSISHTPRNVGVWLGTPGGWEHGSVTALFQKAKAWAY